MTEDNMQQELLELKAAVSGLKDKVGSLDTQVHVVKHDVANLTQMLTGFASRLDKCEERLGQKIEALGDKFSALNTRQEKGSAYIAGVMCAAGVVGSLLMLLAKFLFQGAA